MSFFRTAYNILTEKRDIKEPMIIKDINERSNIVENLNKLASSDDPTLNQKKIAKHLQLFSIGQSGEKSVLFELKNTMLPMVVLHDVNIAYGDYKAQLDFVIITHKFILILEVKKLFGDVKITDKGEFQRIIRRGTRITSKEGMYSPINQVERHVGILEKYLKDNKLINRCPVRYAVTFANPKTILEVSKNAPKEVKSRVLRHDQIKTFLSNELKKESPSYMLDKQVMEIANFINENSLEVAFNKDEYVLDVHSPVEKALSTEKKS